MPRRAAVLAVVAVVAVSCSDPGVDLGGERSSAPSTSSVVSPATEPRSTRPGPGTTAGSGPSTTAAVVPDRSTVPDATAPIVTEPGPDATGWTAVDVIDGDTLVVGSADGTLTVRLIGINAPEEDECFASEATAALADLVADLPLVLVSDTTDVDRYGRALRYVETASGDVGAALVAGGFAIARRYEPDTARADRYEAAQAAAQAAGRGLWAADACGEPVGGASIAISIHEDAAGNDNMNLNDEWVRFTNTGASELDLDGWVVADESASHRYTFRGLVLAPGASVTLHTGCGADSATERYWCMSGSAVWNNDGDTVFLRDPAGNTVASLGY